MQRDRNYKWPHNRTSSLSPTTSTVDCAGQDTSLVPCLPGTPAVYLTPSPPSTPISTLPSSNTVEPSGEQPVASPSATVGSSPPTSIHFDSVPIPTFLSSPSPVPPVTQSAITSSSKNHTGAIVGGVIGGLAFFALLAALYLFRKPLLARLRRNRRAPSAEFMSHPVLFSNRGLSSGNRNSTPPLLRGTSPFQYTYADEESPPQEPPPSFTPGGYTDPVIEKVNAAAAARREMYEAHVSGNGLAKSTKNEWV